jgi:hypothetical protein
MRLRRSIYKVVPLILAAVGLLGCIQPRVEIAETADSDSAATVDPRGYDPLELAHDRDIVPALYPRAGEIVGKRVIQEKQPDASLRDSTRIESASTAGTVDPLNSQTYRVQLFTGLVYGEARQIARVAEEIFDQPVYVDYEVPNFKVRVGNWADRSSAEAYQQKARSVGYANAWVVMVGVNVREVAPLYDDLSGVPGLAPDSVGDSASSGSGGVPVEN